MKEMSCCVKDVLLVFVWVLGGPVVVTNNSNTAAWCDRWCDRGVTYPVQLYC